MQDSKIKEHWAEIAQMELFQQLGVLPNSADPTSIVTTGSQTGE